MYLANKCKSATLESQQLKDLHVFSLYRMKQIFVPAQKVYPVSVSFILPFSLGFSSLLPL